MQEQRSSSSSRTLRSTTTAFETAKTELEEEQPALRLARVFDPIGQVFDRKGSCTRGFL